MEQKKSGQGTYKETKGKREGRKEERGREEEVVNGLDMPALGQALTHCFSLVTHQILTTTSFIKSYNSLNCFRRGQRSENVSALPKVQRACNIRSKDLHPRL